MNKPADNNYLELMARMIEAIRHCSMLKLEPVEASQGKVKIRLPYQQKLIGNPATGSIHGGALTTLMDSACGFAAIMALDEPQICPTLDLRIDYMSAAKSDEAMIGAAEIYRITTNVIFARGVAYQDESRPVAHCVATFMRLTDPTHNVTLKDIAEKNL